MTTLTIRRSGGASIISIPKAILKTQGLHEGAQLDLSIEDNKIVLTPTDKTLSLEEVLEGSPKKRLSLTEEDQVWLNGKPRGKEI